MSDFLDFFRIKKNLINLLLLGILVLALPLGVDLIRQQQIIKSRALAEPIVFAGDNVEQKDGKWIAKAPQISLEITSPLGPPASPRPSTSPSPGSSPSPSGTKFVLYWGNTPVSIRITLEGKYGITWLNHAGLDPGVTIGGARTAGIIGPDYWPGYSVYRGDPNVVNNADLSPYSQPAELIGHPERLVLYWGSTPKENRLPLEGKYNLTWLNHAGLPAGMGLDAARSAGIIGSNYWPGYSVYNGDRSVLTNADLAPYAKPQELK